jgi:antitoxin YefM
MLIVSSREFRENQKKYFDLVDQNEQVIVQRGKDKAYMIIPVHSAPLFPLQSAPVVPLESAPL